MRFSQHFTTMITTQEEDLAIFNGVLSVSFAGLACTNGQTGPSGF